MALTKLKHNQKKRPVITEEDKTTIVTYKNQFGRETKVTRAFALNAEYRGEGEIVEKKAEQPKAEAPKKKK